MVRIRLKRMGRRHRPFYRINAIEKREQRDGRVIEHLGWYDPMAKEDDKRLEINAERVKHWLSHGAQPTDTVRGLLASQEIIDAAEYKAFLETRTARKRAGRPAPAAPEGESSEAPAAAE